MRHASLLVLLACLGALAACSKKKNNPAPSAPPAAEPTPEEGATEAGDGSVDGPAPAEVEDLTLVRLTGRLLPPPPPAEAVVSADEATVAEAAAETFQLICTTVEARPSTCDVELVPPDYEFTVACGDFALIPFGCALRDAADLTVAPVVLAKAHTVLAGHGDLVFEVELLPQRRLAIATIDEGASSALGGKAPGELVPSALPDLSGRWELRRRWCGRKKVCDEEPDDGAPPPPPRDPDQTVYLSHDVESGKLELWRSQADYAVCHDDAGRPLLGIFPPDDGAAVALSDKLGDVEQYLTALATPFGEALATRLDVVSGARAVALGLSEDTKPSEHRASRARARLAALTSLLDTARHYAADFYVGFDAEGNATTRPFCEVERGFYDVGAELPVHLEALCGEGAALSNEQIVQLLEKAQAALAKSCVPWVGLVEDWTGYDGGASFPVVLRTYCASDDGRCLDGDGVYKGELPWREAAFALQPSYGGRFSFSSHVEGAWSLVGKDAETACSSARFAGFSGQLVDESTLDAVRLHARSESCPETQPQAPEARPIDTAAKHSDRDDFGGTDFGELQEPAEWYSVRGTWTRSEE